MTDLAPDFTAPILAARTWRLDPDGSLVSITWPTCKWPVSEFMTALCVPMLDRIKMMLAELVNDADDPFSNHVRDVINRDPGHPSPTPWCQCGLYAVADRRRLRVWRTNTSVYLGHRDTHLIGVVRLWGRVIPGDLGWRAQYAAIEALILRHPFDLRTRRVARTYGVPVLWRWPHLTKLEEVIG